MKQGYHVFTCNYHCQSNLSQIISLLLIFSSLRNGAPQIRCVNVGKEIGGIKVSVTEAVLDYLAEKGFDPQFGARPLKRVMQREILNELSKEIIAGKIGF